MVEKGKYIEYAESLDTTRPEGIIFGYSTELEIIIELTKKIIDLEERIIKIEAKVIDLEK